MYPFVWAWPSFGLGLNKLTQEMLFTLCMHGSEDSRAVTTSMLGMLIDPVSPIPVWIQTPRRHTQPTAHLYMVSLPLREHKKSALSTSDAGARNRWSQSLNPGRSLFEVHRKQDKLWERGEITQRITHMTSYCRPSPVLLPDLQVSVGHMEWKEWILGTIMEIGNNSAAQSGLKRN